MKQRRYGREPECWSLKDQYALWGARTSLIGGIIAYLVLAALAIRWRPHEPFIASIFIFLAGHSAAYLLYQELRRYGDDPPS